MSRINFEGAKEILENVNDKDSVAVIHHDDGDGFCSGVIYYEWCKERGADVNEFTYCIGKSKLTDWDLKKFNKIIATDLASGYMAEELIGYDDKEILFLDHHPEEKKFADNVSYLITTDEGYIPASRTAGELTKLSPLLALAGTITDMGHIYPENEKFIESSLEKFNMSLEDFTNNVSSVISNTIYYFDKDHRRTFNEIKEMRTIDDLEKIEKYSHEVETEIQYFMKDYEENKERLGSINFYIFEPKFNIKGTIINLISANKNHGIYIFASPKKQEKQITFSARSNSDEVNVSEILRAGTDGLEGSNAGGHPRAAGGAIMEKDLEKFKENVRNFMNSKNN